MGIAEAMQIAASKACEIYWHAEDQVWVVAAVSYDADACSLSSARLAAVSRDEFIALYIPDRP